MSLSLFMPFSVSRTSNYGKPIGPYAQLIISFVSLTLPRIRNRGRPQWWSEKKVFLTISPTTFLHRGWRLPQPALVNNWFNQGEYTPEHECIRPRHDAFFYPFFWPQFLSCRSAMAARHEASNIISEKKIRTIFMVFGFLKLQVVRKR